jgi:TonB family protein
LKFDTDGVCNSIFAAAKIRWPAYRAATLQFRVALTGTVETPFVAISSGDQLFDAKAVECMKRLSYVPAQLSNTPTEVSWAAAVLWSPHTGLAFANGRDIGSYCPDGDFPAGMWKGDPPNPTEISFQTVYGPFSGDFAIEKESGNPELDQAALACLKNRVPAASPQLTSLSSAFRQSQMSFGTLLRFNWHDGHAFVLNIRGN